MLIKLNNEQAKELVNQGYMTTCIRVEDDKYLAYYYMTENIDNKDCLNVSNRKGDFEFTDNIFNLFYNKDFQNDGYLEDCIPTVFDKLEEFQPFGNDYYLSDGNMEEIYNKLKHNYYYVLVSNSQKSF